MLNLATSHKSHYVSFAVLQSEEQETTMIQATPRLAYRLPKLFMRFRIAVASVVARDPSTKSWSLLRCLMDAKNNPGNRAM